MASRTRGGTALAEGNEGEHKGPWEGHLVERAPGDTPCPAPPAARSGQVRWGLVGSVQVCSALRHSPSWKIVKAGHT